MEETSQQAPDEPTIPLSSLQSLHPTTPSPGEGVHVTEGFHTSWDGRELFCRHWTGPRDSNATVVLMHGYAEHSGRYHHVATGLVEAGYDVRAIDARGHGRSPGVRGHIDRFEVFVRDLESVVQHCKSESSRPVFVVGHSHGGTIALRYALMSPRDVAGFVVTSPFLGIAMQVPAPKRIAGELMSRVWPTLAIPAGLDATYTCRDPQVVDHYVRDPLVFSSATARWYTEVTRTHLELAQRAREIVAPCLFLVAGSDGLVDPDATRKVFSNVAADDRAMEVFEDAYHELLNEPNWTSFLAKIIDWLDARSSAKAVEK